MTDLTYKPCESCGRAAREVVGYFEHPSMAVLCFRSGWYCADCKVWMPAVGRERVVASGNNQ